MAKKVTVIEGAEGIGFEIKGRKVSVSDKMKIEDAELIAGLYPGVYVEVVEAGVQPAKAAKAE